MLVLYYGTVAILIWDNKRICESKLEKISISSTKISKSQYGAETQKQIKKLENKEEFKKYIK